MTTSDAMAVVRAQLDAYNSHDLERLLSYYAPAVIVDGDGKLLDDGHDAVRSAMGRVFERMPDVRGEYPVVIQVGEWVAVHAVVPNWASAIAPSVRCSGGAIPRGKRQDPAASVVRLAPSQVPADI